MRKIIIFFIALILFIFLYCARGILLVPYLQEYVSTKMGHSISIGNFSLFPFKLSLKNVDVDSFIKARDVTFKLDLFKLLFNISSPIKGIKQIEVSHLEIDLKDNKTTSSLNQSGNENKSVLKLPEMDLDVYIDEVLIKQANFLNITDAHIYANTNTIKADSNLHIAGKSVKLESLLKQKKDYLFEGTVLLTYKNKLNMYITSEGIIDLLSLNYNWKISIVNLYYRGFDFGGTSGTFFKNEKSINIKVIGNFGKFEADGFLSDFANASAFIDLSKTSKSVAGNLNINFKERKDLKELNLKASKLKAFNFDFGSFELLSSKNKNGTYKVAFDYGLKRRIEAVYLKDGNYEGDLILRDKKTGYVKGNIKTGAIFVDAKNINVTDMPLIPFMVKSARGKVNIFGSINEVSGKIDFFFKNLKISNMKSVDAKGTVVRNRDRYTFDFYRSDDSFLLKHVVRRGNILYTDCKFNEVNISSILKVIGHSGINISGTSYGNIRYEKGEGIKINLNAFDGKFYGNNFKEFKVKGEADLNKVEIESFVITNASNTAIVDIRGLIGFTDENPRSSIYFDLKDINVAGIKSDCSGEFQGYLGDGNLVKGVVNVSGAKVGGVPLGIIKSDMNISTKKIELSNLKSDNGLNASLSANFEKNDVTGIVDFKNTDIKGIYPGVAGLLDASVKFSGKLTNPYIEVSCVLKKGAYLSQPLSLSSSISYKDGIVSVNKADIISGKAKIALKGQYCKLGRLQLNINNLNEDIINVFSGGQLPFKGELFGKGEMLFSGKKSELKMFLSTKNAYVGSLKLKDLKTEIEIVDKNVNIKSASAKISNSEIRIDKSFCNLNNNKYFLDIFLLNVHAGSADLFGSVKLSGDIIKDNGGFTYSGIVDLNNLWLNHYKLNHCLFNYSFKDARLKLFQKPSENEDNDVAISSEIIFGDTLSVRKLNIAKKLSYFDMSGDFSKDHISFEAKCFGIDLKFLANLFDFTGGLDGNANIYIKLIGKLNNLKGSMSATSTNGSLMKVLFDKLSIYLDFYDSRVYIKEAYVAKRNGINIDIKGSFPIHLGGKKSKEFIDIAYEIEDKKLSILNYLSDGFLTPLSGRLLLKGHIGGSYKNLKNNCTLSIYSGMFKSNNYFDKIKNASVEMSLTDNSIKINKFTFNSGAGKVNIAGQINLNNFVINDFDIKAATEGKVGIPISVPQLPISKFMGSKSVFKDYSSGKPLFDVKISGTLEKPLIEGHVILESTRFTFPGEKNAEISNFSLPDNTEFNLDLRTGVNTRFENSAVCALINGSLHIDGSLNNLRSQGIIELTSGRIDCLGIGFDIVGSKLEIVDDNQVYITAEGETVVPSKTGGEPETIKLSIKRSKISELSTNDAISFISKDNPNMDSQKALDKAMGAEQDKEITSSALRFLDQSLSTPLARSFLRKVGIADNFRASYINTDYTVSANENSWIVNLLSGTRYTIEKNISKDILFGYNVTFDEFDKKLDLRHGMELQYRLAQNLFLKGSYEFGGEEGSREHEKSFILQHQFRF
jgi:hypothetical protein